MIGSGGREPGWHSAAERRHCPPLEEVFAFVANPGNDARWGSNLVEVMQVSPGPLGVKATFCYKARFGGRPFELVRE
jgi:hypothetical protein